jgi:hypothetical protein
MENRKGERFSENAWGTYFGRGIFFLGLDEAWGGDN